MKATLKDHLKADLETNRPGGRLVGPSASKNFTKHRPSESYEKAFEYIKLAQLIWTVPYAHKGVEDWPRQVKWPIPDADRIYI